MKFKTLTTAAFLAVLVASFSAQALEVRPLVATFDPSQKAGTMTITNTDDTEKTYQVMVDAWTVVGGKQVRTRTKTDIRFAPSIVTLAPGASQTVRYVHTAPVAGGEKAYRLRVEEIPAEVEPTESGVIYAIVMDFPWIWRAAGATPELSARWDGTDLLVKNSGNATAQLVGLTAGATIKKGLLGYVLPGEEGRFKVGAKAATVSLVVNGEAMNLVAR